MRQLAWIVSWAFVLAGCASPNVDHARDLNQDGIDLYRQGQYALARESFQAALNLRPDDPEISYHLALAFEASGARAQSQTILQTLVKRGGSFGDLDAAKDLLASKLKMVGQTQSGH